MKLCLGLLSRSILMQGARTQIIQSSSGVSEQNLSMDVLLLVLTLSQRMFVLSTSSTLQQQYSLHTLLLPVPISKKQSLLMNLGLEVAILVPILLLFSKFMLPLLYLNPRQPHNLKLKITLDQLQV